MNDYVTGDVTRTNWAHRTQVVTDATHETLSTPSHQNPSGQAWTGSYLSTCTVSGVSMKTL